jgi:hypothetical protein
MQDAHAVRYWLGCVGLSAALTSVGCAAGGSTSPSATSTPVPLSTILEWTGSASYSEDITPSLGNWKLSFTGPLTWHKNDNPPAELPLSPGHLRYRLASGQMHVTYTGTRTRTGVVCSDQAIADLPLDPNDPVDDPLLQSYLDIAPDGHYVGWVGNTVTLSIARVCPATEFRGSFDGDFTMRLRIEGTLPADRRMQGNMPTVAGVTQTATGSWDFSPR